METRPRDGGFVSFANHLATLDVALPLDRALDAASMARAVQAQVDAQRRANRPFKRLLAERALVGGMTLAQMQRIVFESKHPSYNLNFSNLIALDFPTLAGDGWRVEEVLITTPVTPRTGIALTAIRYDGRLVFNFNYKAIGGDARRRPRRCHRRFVGDGEASLSARRASRRSARRRLASGSRG